MSDNAFKDFSDLQLSGICALFCLVQAIVDVKGEEYVKGGFFWATHKSDVDFPKEKETQNQFGTGNFDRSGDWYIGFYNKTGVALSKGLDFQGNLLLTTLTGDTKSMVLRLEDVLSMAKHLPKGDVTVVSLNSKGSNGPSN